MPRISTVLYTPFVQYRLEQPRIDLPLVSLCARWLLAFLARAGTPVKPADLVRAAAEANFSRNTLYRARHALADSIVELGTGPRDPNKRWTLAEGPSPSPLPRH